jgi:hypothetical protein
MAFRAPHTPTQVAQVGRAMLVATAHATATAHASRPTRSARGGWAVRPDAPQAGGRGRRKRWVLLLAGVDQSELSATVGGSP